jgi:hypothetical protein
LDQATPHTKENIKPPHTRSQPSPELESALNDDSVQINAPPTPLPSVPSSPKMEVDNDVEITGEKVPDVIDVEGRDIVADVMDVDNPSHNEMAKEFHRMSIASDHDDVDYDHRADPNIDTATKEKIDELLQNNKPTTRGTSTFNNGNTISLDEIDEPQTISSVLKQKYYGTKKQKPISPPSARRVSNKIVPLNTYVLL